MKRLLLTLTLLLSCWGMSSQTRADEEEPASELKSLTMQALNRGNGPSIRVKALNELGELGEKARPATRTLCTAMLDRSASVRAAAGTALQKVFPELYPHVNTLLTDRDYLHHFEALHAITKLDREAKGAVPILLNHLRINAAAVTRLQDLSTDLLVVDFDRKLAIPVVEALVSKDKKGRRAVLTEQAKNSQGLLTPAGQAGLLATADCIVLARIAGDDSVAAQAVAKVALKHPVNLVRFAGIASLQVFGDSARVCLPALKRTMSADPDKAVRELAAKVVQTLEAKNERQ